MDKQQYKKEYRLKNKEKIKEYKKIWRAKNKDKIKTADRKSKQKHRKARYEKSLEWNKRNPDKMKIYRRRASLKALYNLSEEEYDNKLKLQNSSCAICKTPKENFKNALSVDHCHKTDKVRGLLCMPCNSALGLAGDNIEKLTSLIDYLKCYNNLNDTRIT